MAYLLALYSVLTPILYLARFYTPPPPPPPRAPRTRAHSLSHILTFSSVVYPDGSRTTSLPDGMTIVEAVDGTRTQTSPDGTVVMSFADGTRVQTMPDGTCIEKHANGDRTQSNADGSVMHVYTDGTKVRGMGGKEGRAYIYCTQLHALLAR